ncbi:hypothetical protein GLYMA_02G141101v4 [Glycine max]|nr:hypothetical protein GLYMA_02G141101v4 [Glycine max]KAH1060274.1 hypothetical protein GYH30_003980 [Glycine max]
MILNLNPEELSRNRVSVSVNYNAMVYITSWDEFVERSVQLFRADPDSTRYVMKYRHCDGKLVLKVTDNRQVHTKRSCLKQKTMNDIVMPNSRLAKRSKLGKGSILS